MPNRMLEARNALILRSPFFGVLSLKLQLVENENIKTLCTNGVTLQFNPEYISALPFDQLVGGFAHEVSHCAAGHHVRREGRDLKLWNVACDHAINPMLKADGFALPEGALDNPMFHGKSAEEIYTILRSMPPSENGDSDDGENGSENDKSDQDASSGGVGDIGGTGSFTDGPGESAPATEAELSEQAREWEISTMQAYAAAKAAGQLPGSAKWLVEQIQAPKISWEEILREFITERAQTEYSWLKPNRRYIQSGMYLPSRDNKQLGEIVVLIDASGSTWGPLFEKFGNELNGILEEVKPEGVHVLYWDTQYQGHTSYTDEEGPVKLEARGGGGTQFAGIWNWIAQAGIEPTCVVGFTDLYVDGFGAEPEYPVLWCSTGYDKAPFGEVVKLNL